MKIGDLIRCDDVRGSESLEDGAIYKIVDINQFGNLGVAKQSDYSKSLFYRPLQHFYKPSRFRLIGVIPAQTVDLAKEYKTRSGLDVKLFVISDDQDHPVVGQYYDKKWINEQWKSDGAYYNKSTGSLDLVEVKKPVDNFKSSNCEANFFNDGSIKLNGVIFGRNPTLSNNEFANLVEAYETYSSQN